MERVLSQTIFLGGAEDRCMLRWACAEMAGELARILREEGLGYRRVRLEAETGDGPARAEAGFSTVQGPGRLGGHLAELASRLVVLGPVERLSVVLSGVWPLPAEQTALFEVGSRARKDRLERLTGSKAGELGLFPASSLLEDRREKMLAFYDPLRRARNG